MLILILVINEELYKKLKFHVHCPTICCFCWSFLLHDSQKLLRCQERAICLGDGWDFAVYWIQAVGVGSAHSLGVGDNELE